MPQVSFPIFCLTDKTKFGELSPLFAATVKRLAEQKLSNVLLIYEVSDAPEWIHGTVKPSEQPDRMVLVALEARGRNAIAAAIRAASAKVSVPPLQKKLRLTAKDETPLRNIFKQMADLPLLEFNIVPEQPPQSAVFFLRTREFIAEFRQELPKAVFA